MREILKSNNAVELTFAEAVLKDAGIPSEVFDSHMSIMDGSMVILPRRLMVADRDEARARAILSDALSAPAQWT
jgi:Putative prokaryotic signal transducing protein